MKKAYLGIDIGSISTKGVVIDEYNNIIASSYLNTCGNPISATKRVIKELKNTVNNDEPKMPKYAMKSLAKRTFIVKTDFKFKRTSSVYGQFEH